MPTVNRYGSSYETPDPTQVRFDPQTGMPIGLSGPPSHQVAPRYQFLSEGAVRKGNADLRRSARGYMDQARGLLTSYRPGGAAALASGVFQSSAQVALGSQTDAPDLMFDYREEARQQAIRAAKKRAKWSKIGAIIGGVGSVVSAAATFGAAPLAAGVAQRASTLGGIGSLLGGAGELVSAFGGADAQVPGEGPAEGAQTRGQQQPNIQAPGEGQQGTGGVTQMPGAMSAAAPPQAPGGIQQGLSAGAVGQGPRQPGQGPSLPGQAGPGGQQGGASGGMRGSAAGQRQAGGAGPSQGGGGVGMPSPAQQQEMQAGMAAGMEQQRMQFVDRMSNVFAATGLEELFDDGWWDGADMALRDALAGSLALMRESFTGGAEPFMVPNEVVQSRGRR